MRLSAGRNEEAAGHAEYSRAAIPLLTVRGEVKAKSSALAHTIDLGMQRSRGTILQHDVFVQSPTTSSS